MEPRNSKGERERETEMEVDLERSCRPVVCWRFVWLFGLVFHCCLFGFVVLEFRVFERVLRLPRSELSAGLNSVHLFVDVMRLQQSVENKRKNRQN